MGQFNKGVACLCIISLLTPYSLLAMDTSSVNTDGKAMVCDDICGRIEQLQPDGSTFKNYSGTPDQWRTGAEAWCSKQDSSFGGPGYVENPEIGKGISGDSYCSSKPNAASQEDCYAAWRKTQSCGYLKNSMLVNHCMAYQLTDEGGLVMGAEGTMIALDIITAGVCTTACVAQNSPAIVASGALLQACNISAMGTSAAELIARFNMENDAKWASYINGFGSAAGFAGGVTGAVATGISISKGVGEAAFDTTTQKVMPCAIAALYAIMAGIRIANVATYKSVHEKECNSINDLVGSPTTSTVGGSGTGTTVKSSSGGTNLPYSGSGSGSSSGSSSTNAAGKTSASNISDCMSVGGTWSACVSEYGTEQSKSATGADVNSFNSATPPLPEGVNLKDIAQKAISEGAGAALGSMVSGEAGAAIAALADKAQKEGGELAGLLGISNGSGYSGGGGASRSTASTKTDNGLFGSLFGGANGAAKLASNGSETFGVAPKTDIWHTGTHMNLFEIVSGKIGTVTPRVK